MNEIIKAMEERRSIRKFKSIMPPNTRETIRESSPATNSVFSRVCGEINNKIQQLLTH